MTINLKSQIRDQKEKLEKDFIPAVVYGSGLESTSLSLKLNDFIKVYDLAGESNLIELELGDKGKINVLVKEVQRNPIKDFINHVDFYKVDMDKEITTEIPLEFIGESKAVKESGAMLVKNINEILVECLPSDLVDHIDINISVLEEVGDIIKISDINLPKGMKVLNNLEDSVATIIEQQKEEAPEVKVEELPISEEVNKNKDSDDSKNTKENKA
ncbi:MAG: 50S ribosomal protein L25 [Patescibacteria group bacterium]|jgi:large subunit ribosomal protein L25